MKRPLDPKESAPGGDPWAAFGYLVSGVLFYGGIGWGLSVWLHATYLLPIGILVGAGLGIYLVFARYGVRAPKSVEEPDQNNRTQQDSDIDDSDAARTTRPADDDRGETA